MLERVGESVTFIQQQASGFVPRFALVTGTGLGGLCDEVRVTAKLPYADIPHFLPTTVEGHEGNLILGHIDELPVVCCQGRLHPYEGVASESIRHMMLTLRRLGCDGVLFTNSVGSVQKAHGPGALVLVTDHINLTGHNPLVGPNDENIGPRFPSMSEAYDKRYRQVLSEAAGAEGISLAEGVYAGVMGPSYETPAEIKMLQLLGADVVGMSGVTEVISARHCGLRVALLAAIANYGAGIEMHDIDHTAVVTNTAQAQSKLVKLLQALCVNILNESEI